MTEAGVQPGLEFASRVFVDDGDLQDWTLRELGVVTVGDGRTYREKAQVWDGWGKMGCSMTRQCILRAKGDRGGEDVGSLGERV